MDMTGAYVVKADQQTVWDALNDPEKLKQAIPGCESIEKLSETEMEAVATTAVGPVKAKFKGKVTLSELDPPNSYVLSGEGKGGAAGFAKGTAKVSLAPVEDGTELSYVVNATVGGKLAQIGQRFIDSTAKKLADEFFVNLSEIAQSSMPDGAAPTAPAATAAQTPAQDAPAAGSSGLPAYVWVIGLTIIIAALVMLAESMPAR